MSFIGLGIAQGAANVQDYERGREGRNLAMQEAKLRQKAAEAQFAQSEAMGPLAIDQAKLQLEQLQMQTRQMQASMFKNTAYESFRLYNADRDPKHLNTLVKQAKSSPVGQSLFGNTARVDAVANLPQHKKLLQEAGIQDVDGLLADKNLASQFVVMTDTQGEQSLLDMAQVYAGTGFTQHMADEELNRLNTQSLITQRLRQGQSVNKTTALERLSKEMADELGIPVYEAYERLTKKQSKGGSERERLAEQIMSENPGMDYLEAYEQAATLGHAGSEVERTARQVAQKEGREYTEVLRELQQEKQRTTGQKDVAAANTYRQDLDKAFGGKYFETSFADPVARRKAQPMVTAIEKLSGRELTAEDKRVARSIRTLTALGTQGGGITEAEAGPLDTILRDTKSYFYDELGGNKQAVAAYNAFRNIARNALFGASLTEGERAEFDKSLATLSKQPGTILSQLRVQMDNLRNDMQAIYDFNDEHVSHFYLGKGLDELDDSIVALDERLTYLNRVTAGEGKGGDVMLPAKPVVQPRPDGAPRKSLDEIFGGQ
jgi:hypothetical protein